MKKSRQVPASLIVALAGLSASGCSSSYDECVDPMGNVVSDSSCATGSGGAHWVHHVRSGGFGSSGHSGGFFGG